MIRVNSGSYTVALSALYNEPWSIHVCHGSDLSLIFFQVSCIPAYVLTIIIRLMSLSYPWSYLSLLYPSGSYYLVVTKSSHLKTFESFLLRPEINPKSKQ